MTPMETIAAAAVAILGTWLLWPCLLAAVLILGLGAVFGVTMFMDWREARKREREKGAKR